MFNMIGCVIKLQEFKLRMNVNFTTCALIDGMKMTSADWPLACENIRFSTLFAAGDFSRGGTSATQRQKFHTDDLEYVQNPVRSPDWSTK